MKTATELADRLSHGYPSTERKEAAAMLLQQAEQIESLRIERDALKQQAQIHAMEAKTANSTIYDIYQVVSGGTGEPGNWNGARPVREAFDALKADAERYRWLKDNRSYAYAMQPDSPAECGIEFQWQQCSYEERNWNIDSAIDDEISRAAIDAMKGTT